MSRGHSGPCCTSIVSTRCSMQHFASHLSTRWSIEHCGDEWIAQHVSECLRRPHISDGLRVTMSTRLLHDTEMQFCSFRCQNTF